MTSKIYNILGSIATESDALMPYMIDVDMSSVYNIVRKADLPPDWTLGELFCRAHESVTGCHVVCDEQFQGAIQCGERGPPLRVLAASRSGVFIVRIQDEKRVDHAVVMDAQNGSSSIQRSQQYLSFRLKYFQVRMGQCLKASSDRGTRDKG